MDARKMTEVELALELQYVTAAIPHLSQLLTEAVDSRAALMIEQARRKESRSQAVAA